MNSAGGIFPDARRNLCIVFRSPVCWCWVAVLAAVQLWVGLCGGPDLMPGLFQSLGLSRAGIMDGCVWSVATYGFLHGSWGHLAVNALLLLGMGSRVEHMLGGAAVSRVMGSGLLGGALAHLLAGSGLLVGSSAGCLALLLLVVTLSPGSRVLPVPVSGKNIGLGVVIGALVLALCNPELGLPGLMRIGRVMADHGLAWCFKVGHACHLGGALAGWLAGRWILRPRVTLESLRRDRARREAG